MPPSLPGDVVTNSYKGHVVGANFSGRVCGSRNGGFSQRMPGRRKCTETWGEWVGAEGHKIPTLQPVSWGMRSHLSP